MIKEILNGWGNYLKGVTTKEAKRRAKICEGCDFAKKGKHEAIMPDYKIKEISGWYCGVCKCPLTTKARSKDSNCPKNKW